MKRVRVTHPSGHPMPFSENLLAFLHVRVRGRSFKIGEWLSALDADSLHQLASIAERFYLYGQDEDINPDLLFCSKVGFEAETDLQFFELDIEQSLDVIKTFCLAISLEEIQRHGWLEIYDDLSIQPQSSVKYGITEEGMRNKDSFAKFLH